MGDSTVKVGSITIVDKNTNCRCLFGKKLILKVVGIIEFGKTYTFIQKDADWYLLLLDGKEGFVNSQFVKEVEK